MRGHRRGFVLAVVGLMLLSACKVEMHVATEVEEDGSGHIAVTVLLGETVRSTLQEKHLKSEDPTVLAELEARGEDTFERGAEVVDLLEQTVPVGWSAEPVKDGKLEGLRLTAGFDRLDQLPGLLAPFADWGDEIAFRQGGRDAEDVGIVPLTRGFSLTRDGSVFRFEAKPDAREYEGADGGPNHLVAEFTVSVKLPGGIREHNADEEKDGTLTWRIAPGTSRSISATSDLDYNPSSIPWGLIGGATAGTVLAGLLWLRFVRSRRRSSGDDEPPAAVEDEEPVPVPV